MKKNCKLFFTVGLIPLIGCNSEIIEPTSEKIEAERVSTTKFLSEEEAIETANVWMQKLTGDTRSGREINSVERISIKGGEPATRSGDGVADPYYLVNFANIFIIRI